MLKNSTTLYINVLFVCLQVSWKNWLVGLAEFSIAPDTKFSDIIVPTIDNIRSSFIMEMLLINKKYVSHTFN
jgi:hypothetical protein